jgi:hypothetical protein
MLWLFGQIWLWSLISFALGAAVTALLLTRVNRERAKPESAPSANQPHYATTTPQYANPSYTNDSYDQRAQPEYPGRPPLEWPSDPIERIDTGHRQGMLPPAEWPPDQRTEQIEAIEEPAWPRAEDWPSTEHRPGRDA